ncbi:hypothetical protein AAFF_G00023400 [Aldrovandia affinis]|uniref:Uncharacterized protein n=1 Tax=Aldrovandia affinis TaxID=143900 RepID=A0AAD7T6M8_9TELE|nr:hypothetical protein AAFF_G00023400 [Aldrovandia affinis]
MDPGAPRPRYDVVIWHRWSDRLGFSRAVSPVSSPPAVLTPDHGNGKELLTHKKGIRVVRLKQNLQIVLIAGFVSNRQKSAVSTTEGHAEETRRTQTKTQHIAL